MHGHVNPNLELVSQLVRRGEEVIFYTTGAFQEKIRSTGAVCRFYADSASRLNFGMEPNPAAGKSPRENSLEKQIENVFGNFIPRLEDIKTQEQDLYQEIKAEKPDYVVYDYVDVFWGKILAQKLGVPAIASVPSFATCQQLVEKDPTGVIKYILQMSPLEPPFKNNVIDLKDFINFISNRIASMYNLKSFDILNYGNSDLLNIVHNSRYFQPGGDVFAETFKFIGCSTDSREEAVDFPFEKVDKRPLIYICLGTVFNRCIDFYRKCFKAFAGTGNQVILSVGNRVDLAELGNIPDNFIVRNYVPQLEILKRANLFITHGGLNSAKEGIFHTVPLMVFPQNGDQFAVAHQVNRLGAGIGFENSDLTPGELRKAAEEASANETFHQNSRKIKESFEKAGGAKRAVDEIFKLKEKIGIS